MLERLARLLAECEEGLVLVPRASRQVREEPPNEGRRCGLGQGSGGLDLSRRPEAVRYDPERGILTGGELGEGRGVRGPMRA